MISTHATDGQQARRAQQPDSESRGSVFVRRVVRQVVRRPVLVLSCAGALVALSLLSAVFRLELKTSNLDLIDQDLPEVVRFQEFARSFGSPNFAVVVLEGENRADLAGAVRRLLPMLKLNSETRTVLGRLDYSAEVLELNGLDEFMTSYDEKQFFVFVQPKGEESDLTSMAPFLAQIRDTLSAAHLEAAGIRAGITGIPQYALDDRDLIQRDIGRISGVSVAGVVLVLAFALGGARWPLILATGLAVSLMWVAGVAGFWPGHLTLLSAFFASILFGIGIDFGIHTVARMREEASDRPVEQRLVVAMTSIAPALITAALTTAAVFFALMGSGFRGFAELGWIAGVGMLLSIVAGFTVLPALVVLFARQSGRERSAASSGPGRNQHFWRALTGVRGKAIGLLLVVLTALSPILPRPAFDSDYTNLQPENSETVRLERAMVASSDLSPQFAVFVVADRTAAAELTDILLDEPMVGDVRSAADMEGLVDERGDPLELPAALRGALISQGGDYAVYAYPADDAWSEAGSERFVERMKELDANVTGMPILGRFMVERTREALRRTLWLAGAALGCALLLTFRRLTPALLAAVPTALTLLSLEGTMRLLDIAWNPISIMALPVVLGVAVDDGVHLVHRFLGERDVGKTLLTTGRSVVVTSATTLAGFAGLCLSAHRGLASFAVVVVLGVVLALAHSLLVLPTLLQLVPMGQRGGRSV